MTTNTSINWKDLRTPQDIRAALETRYGAVVAQELMDKMSDWDKQKDVERLREKRRKAQRGAIRLAA